MRPSLVRPVVAWLLAASLAGCGDDDGVSILEPGRGLVGMWVRYSPLGVGPAALPHPTFDTLFVANDLSGVWSRAVTESDGVEPLRFTDVVRLETRGVSLLLYTLYPPCPACMTGGDTRLSSVGVKAQFRVQRPDGDHLVITPSTPLEAGVERYYYVRRPVPRTIEE